MRTFAINSVFVFYKMSALFSHADCTLAIVERLAPSVEKKLPKVSISSVSRFLAIIQESVLAKVTNSHPEEQLQRFIDIT